MKSSQLLILGNGFDVHCGLKSKYIDFFKFAILDNTGKRFGLRQMKIDDPGFWERLLFEYYKKYEDKDYNWCDIETIIKDTLWLICYGEDKKSTNLEKGIWKKAFEWAKVGRYPEEVDSADTIIGFISLYCSHFFLSKRPNKNDKADLSTLNSLLINLLQELKLFEKRFCKYLKGNIRNPQNEKEINTTYILNAVNLLAKITKFTDKEFKSMDEIIDNLEYEKQQAKKYDIKFEDTIYLCGELYDLFNTNILSFNYTALFDILKAKSPCKYSNVHGKLCSGDCATDCSGSSIIFGIDDRIIQTQDANSELRLFSKTYRKMLDSGDPISILPPNDQSVEIIFYGHSLSAADYSYFQSIFDYYDLYGNNNVSLVFYYSKGFENHDAVYKLISEYGKSLTNKEQGENLIHKLLLENRLRIDEI